MAISVVNVVKGSNGTGSTLNISLTVGSTGNALVSACAVFAGSFAPTITTSGAGGSWSHDAASAVFGTASTSLAAIDISSAPNISSGSQTVTETIGGGVGSGTSASIIEIAGLPTSAIRDATSPAMATGTSTTATTNALSNVTADAIYVALNGSNSGSATATETGTTASWTYSSGAPNQLTATDGTTSMVHGAGYFIVASTASRTSAWTVDNNEWAAHIAVYKASGAVAAPPTTHMTVGLMIPIGW